MKLTLEQVLNSVAPYRELQTLKLPPRTALSVYKIGKEIDRELESYREVSNSLYKAYNATETPNGYDMGSVKPEEQEKLIVELTELMKSEVEVKITKIPIEILESTGNNIAAATIGALEWVFEIPEEVVQGQPKPKKNRAAA